MPRQSKENQRRYRLRQNGKLPQLILRPCQGCWPRAMATEAHYPWCSRCWVKHTEEGRDWQRERVRRWRADKKQRKNVTDC